MKHAHSTVLVLAILLLAACGTTGSQGTDGDTVQRDSAALEGVWEDTDTGTRFTVALQRGIAHVTAIVDSDGEVFEIRSEGWEDGKLTWTYFVPSTGYENKFVVTRIGADMLDSTWAGTGGSGTQDLARVK
ncbi:MAG: hypothetical protein R3F39_14710 [Myxococcota bacterium]